MPNLNKQQLLFTFFVMGLFMGQFSPITGGMIGILMVILGWKNIFKWNN